MAVIVEGIVTYCRLVWKNIEGPSMVNPFTNNTLLSDEQNANAVFPIYNKIDIKILIIPIEVRVEGIVSSVNKVLPLPI